MGKEQLHPIMQIIEQWLLNKRVGSITINFFKGGCSSVKLNYEETLIVSEEKSTTKENNNGKENRKRL